MNQCPSHLTRDFVGYGGHPPNPRWPNNARVALNIVLNYEEGSEPSVPDGDGSSETGLIDASGGMQTRDLAAESMFEYGSRVGVWRLLRILRERSAPATMFACAVALERNPELVAAINGAQLDICCHGRRWIKHAELTETRERQEIAQAVASLTHLTGVPPAGWYCRYTPSVNTRRLLVEHGGFLYNSDSYNDELPYWTGVGETPHLVVPYSLVNNDARFIRGALASADDFVTFLKDALELLHREGEKTPKMMSVGMHMRLMGHPGRAVALEQFLDYAQSLDGVWICRRSDIAQHWHRTHPPS